jgi:endonuclease/exonuclease/phosphatase family metal-dependent hydrolase
MVPAPLLYVPLLLGAWLSPMSAIGNLDIAENGPTLAVMTFNIRYGTADDGPNRWGERRELVFEVFRTHCPDVVGIQEGLRFQLDELREAVPGYAEVGVGRDDGKDKGEYAAILYREDRFRLVKSGTFWFSPTPETAGSMGWGARLPRICTWVWLAERSTGRTFRVFNVHLDHASQSSREHSAAALLDAILDQDAPSVPVVVTGDFNSPEDNAAIRILKEGVPRVSGPEKGSAKESSENDPAKKPGESGATDKVGESGAADEGAAKKAEVEGLTAAETRSFPLRDSFRAVHPDATDTGTFSAFSGVTTGPKIDYIFVSPEVEVLEAAILRDHRGGQFPSDHFPVTAKIRLPAAGSLGR